MVPAAVWPSYVCTEFGGQGWEVHVEEADRRAGAVLVSFVAARDPSGKRYQQEWLTLESLVPL